MEVLLVSRSERARAWMGAALGPDWTVLEATDGLQAMRIARAEIPELVIADETTEPFGAFGLARELKALPDPPMVLILLERAQDTWLAKWSGADRWLQQPIDPFRLASAARELGAQLEASEEPAAEPAPQ